MLLIVQSVPVTHAQDVAVPPSDDGVQTQTREVDLPLNEEEARAHFLSGQGFFRRADYERALRAFESSFELSGRLELKYNIGICHERLAQLSGAIDAYEAYITWARESGSQSLDLDALDVRIITLRRRLSEEQQAAQAAAAEPEPEPEPEPNPVVAVPIDEPAPATGGLRVPAIITLASGAAALAVGAVFGGLVLAENSELSDCKSNRLCTDEELSALETYRLATDVSLGVGLVSVAAGVTMLVVHLRRQRTSNPAVVTPTFGPSYAGLSVQVELP